jgi:hypothetical protein
MQINIKFEKYTYFDYSISFSLIADKPNRLNPFEPIKRHYYLKSFKFGEVVFPKYEATY